MAAEKEARGNTNDRGQPVRFGSWVFLPDAGVVRSNDQETTLPPRASSLLERLIDARGAIVTKEELVESVWPDTAVSDHSVSEALRVLRRVLGDDPREPRYIQTLPRRGYRFVAPVESLGDAPSTVTATAKASGQTAEGGAEAPAMRRSLIRWRLALASAALVIAALAIIAAWSTAGSSVAIAPVRTIVTPPDGVRVTGSYLDISPDGRRIVFNGRNERTYEPQAYVRDLDDFVPRPLNVD